MRAKTQVIRAETQAIRAKTQAITAKTQAISAKTQAITAKTQAITQEVGNILGVYGEYSLWGKETGASNLSLTSFSTHDRVYQTGALTGAEFNALKCILYYLLKYNNIN
uniref:Uncharacterized protein n=1 Tax=Cacopsylla melanoneura TaxID=428564 RepID=A0A8D9DYC2_9HEMI